MLIKNCNVMTTDPQQAIKMTRTFKILLFNFKFL